MVGMKKLVIYYSRGGNTRRLAQQLSNAPDTDLVQVDTPKKRGMLASFFSCPAALRQKPARAIKMTPEKVDFDAYDLIIVMGPIWAGHPAPPVNNIINMLPPGKDVELRMVSAGGTSKRDKVIALVKGRGCNVTGYHDVKSAPDK